MVMRKNFLEICRQLGHASSKESPQQEVRCCEARRSWWPKPTSDRASTETVLQDSCLCLRILGVRPHLIKIKNPFLSIAAEEWMSQNFLIAFVSKCLFTQGCYHNSVSNHFATNTKRSQIQMILMHFVWVLSTPYFTLYTINVSSQEQPCFIRIQ